MIRHGVRQPKHVTTKVAPTYAEIGEDNNASSSDDSSNASPDIVTSPTSAAFCGPVRGLKGGRGGRSGCNGGCGVRGNAQGSGCGGQVGWSTAPRGRGISGGRGRAELIDDRNKLAPNGPVDDARVAVHHGVRQHALV